MPEATIECGGDRFVKFGEQVAVSVEGHSDRPMTEQPLDNLGRQFSSTPILGIDAPRRKVMPELMQRVPGTVFFACCQARRLHDGLIGQ